MTTTPPLDESTPPKKTISHHRASVPLSVYRELAQELQATRGQAETLKAQNRQLVKINRQLRQEIEKIILQAQDLERFARDGGENSDPSFVIPVRPRIVSPPKPAHRTAEIQPAPPKAIESPSESPRDSWTIVVAIALVVFTSGLGAFWLVSGTRR
jgi:hypothetical protein